ncbi:MAG: hypothetical protein ACLQNE_30335 [Thermoguttaceae bacterium]
MKSQERHRLEKNVLADWIAQTIQQINPYLTPILVIALVVVLVFGATTFWVQRAAQGSGVAWSKLYATISDRGVNEASAEAVAEEYHGTNVAHWATLLACDARLDHGCQLLFAADRSSAINDLQRAVEGCTTVLKETNEPALRERALFCRARAYEALAGTRQSGALDNAIADFKELLANDRWAKGPYAEMARHSVTNLENPEFRTFYDKFVSYEPKPQISGPGVPGQRPPATVPEPNSPAEFSSLMNLGGDLKASEKTPAKPAAAKAEPVKSAPAPTKATTAAPVKSEPAKTVPAKTEPAKTEPGKGDASKAAPGKSGSAEPAAAPKG